MLSIQKLQDLMRSELIQMPRDRLEVVGFRVVT